MSEHIYHATATLAELGLAMSIATVTKLIRAEYPVDVMARDTTQSRIKSNDGKIPWFFYRVGCWLSKALGKAGELVPVITLVAQSAVIGGLAFCTDGAGKLLFMLSAACTVTMMLYVYVNRETLAKTESKPMVEPVE